MTVLPESPAICDLGYVIDIVAHSMGYAHTIGVLSGLIEDENGDSFLAGGYTFDNFYILAPENGCSFYIGNDIDFEMFENVWQYGTEEWQDANGNPFDYASSSATYQPANSENYNDPWLQDGVAPQCAVPGLSFDETRQNLSGFSRRRIRFPVTSEFLTFAEAHFGSSYGWIFDRFGKLDAGYVSPRE